jgi:hypothetical protein
MCLDSPIWLTDARIGSNPRWSPTASTACSSRSDQTPSPPALTPRFASDPELRQSSARPPRAMQRSSFTEISKRIRAICRYRLDWMDQSMFRPVHVCAREPGDILHRRAVENR